MRAYRSVGAFRRYARNFGRVGSLDEDVGMSGTYRLYR